MSRTAVPVEDYLRTSYEPEMEYVDGYLVDRHVGEYEHSRLEGLIAAALGSRGRSRFRTFVALRIRVSDTRYRVPDVCAKALPHEKKPILTQPDLVVEIISRDDEPIAFLEKIADYTSAGIPYIWIIDPYKRTLTVVEHSVIRPVTGQVLETPLVGQVDFLELFRQLDETPE